ncbi:MAG: hypothetical protein VW405_03800 [Rhodospirillaceae bacterium]
MSSKRTFFDIPTGELAKVYFPEGDTPTGRRLLRKMKSGARRLTAGEVHVLSRLIPSLDVAGTLARCYELEEMRKREGKGAGKDIGFNIEEEAF